VHTTSNIDNLPPAFPQEPGVRMPRPRLRHAVGGYRYSALAAAGILPSRWANGIALAAVAAWSLREL